MAQTSQQCPAEKVLRDAIRNAEKARPCVHGPFIDAPGAALWTVGDEVIASVPVDPSWSTFNLRGLKEPAEVVQVNAPTTAMVEAKVAFDQWIERDTVLQSTLVKLGKPSGNPILTKTIMAKTVGECHSGTDQDSGRWSESHYNYYWEFRVVISPSIEGGAFEWHHPREKDAVVVPEWPQQYVEEAEKALQLAVKAFNVQQLNPARVAAKSALADHRGVNVETLGQYPYDR